ncbi:YtxH-like protein [bacterium BMS3Abin01]|nr:YtxH-like protein [bacterium BMS3Abin01]
MAKHRRCGLFLLGAGMGAAVGMLLAPKSGKDIRRELFGGSMDVTVEPGTDADIPRTQDESSQEDLKARIEETSARLKAEIETQQEEDGEAGGEE